MFTIFGAFCRKKHILSHINGISPSNNHVGVLRNGEKLIPTKNLMKKLMKTDESAFSPLGVNFAVLDFY